MDKKLPDTTSTSGFRRTLLKSSALFRALAAVVTAVCALASGVHLTIAPVREKLQQLTSKWKWLFFGSALIAGLMVVFSLRFYFCLREIDTARRRRGLRLFIITCVVMALLELAVGAIAFTDSRSFAIRGSADEPSQTSEWASFLIVYCLCLLLIALEVISIIIALTCVKPQLYEQVATVKESEDVVELDRRPSNSGNVDEIDFSIEKIDDGATRAEDAEKKPLKQNEVDSGSPDAEEFMLVNNELYGVPQPVNKRPKQIPPPLPPVKYDEVNTETPPPIPTSPIPDEADRAMTPRSPTFPPYERRSRASTPRTSPMFPRYEDSIFAHYNPQLGTFHRPRILPDGTAEPPKQQEAS